MTADIDERLAQHALDSARRLKVLVDAQAVTLRLAKRSGLVDGYTWPPVPRSPGRIITAGHRQPPLPFHSFKHLGAGHCRVCGQPIYTDDGGYKKPHRSRQARPSKRTWHTVCVTTYTLMTKPAHFGREIAHRQNGLCELSGASLDCNRDIDHRVPLYLVARTLAARPWFELLTYWTLDNLRAITLEAHKAKNAAEAAERAGCRPPDDQQPELI